ncbi:hypothetical protein ASG66_06615 [Bacillus sp. Leaf406]|nr:hypothetical protein ASG66_06615 [Bacillus sp. Leaf406]
MSHFYYIIEDEIMDGILKVEFTAYLTLTVVPYNIRGSGMSKQPRYIPVIAIVLGILFRTFEQGGG